MKRLMMLLVGLMLLLLVQAAPALASCSTHTYVIDGRMVMCTTCCFGGSCTTTCF